MTGPRRDPPAPSPWAERLTRLAVLGLAILCTVGAYRLPESVVLPTLAFFGWAHVFTRWAIEWPGELGFVPSREEGDRPEEVDETATTADADVDSNDAD